MLVIWLGMFEKNGHIVSLIMLAVWWSQAGCNLVLYVGRVVVGGLRWSCYWRTAR